MVATLTGMDLATLGLRVENGQIIKATEDLTRLGDEGERSAQRTERAWAGVGNPFQDGGFLTGAAAARELSQAMIRDAQQLKNAWAGIGNPFQKGGFTTGAAFKREFEDMVRQQQSLVQVSGPTTRALNAVRGGMQALAFQAAGLPGPLGRITTGLLSFAGGSGLVLGVVAGIGLIALAFQRSAKAVEEAQQAARDAADSFRQLQATQAAAFKGFGEAQLPNLRLRASAIGDAIRDLELQARIQQGLVAIAENDAQRLKANKDIQATQAQIALLQSSQLEATQAIARIQGELAAKKEQMVLDAEREVQLFGVSVERAAQLRGQWAGLTAEQQKRLDIAVATLRQLQAEAELAERSLKARKELAGLAVPGMPTSPVPTGAPGNLDFLTEQLEQFEADVRKIFGDPALFAAMEQSFNRSMQRMMRDGVVTFQSFAAEILRIWVKLAADVAAQRAFEQASKLGVSPVVAGAIGGTAGAVVGGVVALVGGLLNMGEAARIARERLREFERSMEGFRASLTASDLDDQILAVRARADALRQEAREAHRSGNDRARALNEITNLENERIRQLREEAAALRQANIEDAEIRRLRAEGFVVEADAMAFAAAQQRELAEAIRRGADRAEQAALEAAQAAEAQRRLADLERDRIRGLEDLNVRLLRARGFDDQADALAFQLEQQREYAEAVRAGADAITLRRLAEVQYAEAQRFAAEQTQQTITDLTGTIERLRAFTNGLRLNQQLTALSPVQQLAEARRQFEDVLAAARGGDQAAAGRLPEAARAFLEASRAVNASGGRFQVDFTRVLRETEAITQMFADRQTEAERQLEELTRIRIELGDVADFEPVVVPLENATEHLATLVASVERLIAVTVAAAKEDTTAQQTQGQQIQQAIRRGLEGAKL